MMIFLFMYFLSLTELKFCKIFQEHEHSIIVKRFITNELSYVPDMFGRVITMFICLYVLVNVLLFLEGDIWVNLFKNGLSKIGKIC